MINKYGKGAVVQISTVFQSVYHIIVEGSSETGLFRHLSNHVFRSPYVQKDISYGDHLFFENVKNLILILETQQEIKKRSFVS